MKLNSKSRIRGTVLGIGIYLAGLLIKLFLWTRSPYISRDSAYYLSEINSWYAMGSLISNSSMYDGPIHPPFYFFLVKSIMQLGISALNAGLLLNMVLGSLIPIVIYFIAYRISRKQIIAIVCAFITLLHPSINHLSVEIQRDIGYIFFSSLLFLFVIRGTQQKYQVYNWSVGGVLFSCAFMFRIESLEYIPLIVLLLSLLFFYKKISLRTFGIDLSCFLGSSLVCFIFLIYIMGLKYSDLEAIYMSYYNFAERAL